MLPVIPSRLSKSLIFSEEKHAEIINVLSAGLRRSRSGVSTKILMGEYSRNVQKGLLPFQYPFSSLRNQKEVYYSTNRSLFSQEKWGGVRASAEYLLLLTQNNPYAKGAYFGAAYSINFHSHIKFKIKKTHKLKIDPAIKLKILN